MRYNQKRARKSSKKRHIWISTSYFLEFRAFRTLHHPKRHVFLEFLAEKKAFHFSKRSLRAGTARYKELKKSPGFRMIRFEIHSIIELCVAK